MENNAPTMTIADKTAEPIARPITLRVTESTLGKNIKHYGPARRGKTTKPKPRPEEDPLFLGHLFRLPGTEQLDLIPPPTARTAPLPWTERNPK